MADKARPTAGQPAPFIPDLPPEVVRMVTDCCADDPETLANLAQASRDCRALARSYQFATLRLDLSERSRDLIEFLLQDIAEDETAVSPRPRDPDLPPIRECVRRVEVGMVNVDLRGVATETPLPIEEVEDIRERHSLLVSQLSFLLRPGALPNLLSFDTGPRFSVLEPGLLRRIMLSPTIRTLQLRTSTPVRANLPVPVGEVPSQPLPLPMPLPALPPAPATQTDSSSSSSSSSAKTDRPPLAKINVLELDISGSQKHGANWFFNLPSFVAYMLEECGSELRELRFRCLHSGYYWTDNSVANAGVAKSRFELARRRQVPWLPKLVLLYVDRMAALGRTLLSQLLERAPNMRTLVVDISDWEVRCTLVAVKTRGAVLGGLRNLIWYGGGGDVPYTLPEDLNAKLLMAPFPKINGFCIGGNTVVTPSFAIHRILPMFVTNSGDRVGNLTKLSLAFSEDGIPEYVLMQIGRITSLESLHLRVATQTTAKGPTMLPPGTTMPPPTCRWLVRHCDLRACFINLKRLRTLLLEGDDCLLPQPPVEAVGISVGVGLGVNLGVGAGVGADIGIGGSSGSRCGGGSSITSNGSGSNSSGASGSNSGSNSNDSDNDSDSGIDNVSGSDNDSGDDSDSDSDSDNGSENGNGSSSNSNHGGGGGGRSRCPWRRRYYMDFPPSWPFCGLNPRSGSPTVGVIKTMRTGFTLQQPNASYTGQDQDDGEMAAVRSILSDISRQHLNRHQERQERQQQQPQKSAPWHCKDYVAKSNEDRMLNEANTYAEVLPHLRNVNLGGHHFVRDSDSAPFRQAPAFTSHLDPIEAIFGFSPAAQSAPLPDESVMRDPDRTSRFYPPLASDNDEDPKPDPSVPLEEYFCERCFLAAHRSRAEAMARGGSVVPPLPPPLLTQCEHRSPRVAAGWAAIVRPAPPPPYPPPEPHHGPQHSWAAAAAGIDDLGLAVGSSAAGMATFGGAAGLPMFGGTSTFASAVGLPFIGGGGGIGGMPSLGGVMGLPVIGGGTIGGMATFGGAMGLPIIQATASSSDPEPGDSGGSSSSPDSRSSSAPLMATRGNRDAPAAATTSTSRGAEMMTPGANLTNPSSSSNSAQAVTPSASASSSRSTTPDSEAETTILETVEYDDESPPSPVNPEAGIPASPGSLERSESVESLETPLSPESLDSRQSSAGPGSRQSSETRERSESQESPESPDSE